MILVSACLAGINCNYNSSSSPNSKIIELIRSGKAIPICPEQLGGLPTPRSGARISEGGGEDVLKGVSRLLTDDGNDVTEEYLRGAKETLAICRQFGIDTVILKQKSPSCRKGLIQGGKEYREKVEGNGVTTALLRCEGISVFSEGDLENEELWERLKQRLLNIVPMVLSIEA